MFLKHILAISILSLCSSQLLAGVVVPPPSPSLPSEQESTLQDCISLGLSLGLNNTQIDSICPAANSGLTFTFDRLNEFINSFIDTIPTNNQGSGNGTIVLNSEDPNNQGINAGTRFGDISIWANVARTESEYSLVPWEADSATAMFGAYKPVGPSGILGISMGIGGTNVETFFNGGEQDLTDYTLAVYGSTLVSDNISVGANIGYQFRDIDQSRTGVGGTTPFTLGEIVNSKTDSNTWFVSGNIDGFWQLDRAFNLGTHASILYSEEDVDGFTETGATSTATAIVGNQDNELGLLQLGFDIGYTSPGFIEPFIGLDYLYYFERQDISALSSTAVDNDDTEFVYSVGARFFHDNISSSLTYSNNFSREYLDSETISFIISVDL